MHISSAVGTPAAGSGADSDDRAIQEAASLLASLSDTLQSPPHCPPPPQAPSSTEVQCTCTYICYAQSSDPDNPRIVRARIYSKLPRALHLKLPCARS